MRYAHTDAPHTWRDYDAVAAAAAERDDVDGLGIVFTGTVDDDGTQAVGIDIDECIDAYDACTADAAAIVNRAATLTERSWSGRGLHIYLRIVGGMHIVDAAGRTVGRMRAAEAGRPTFGKTPAVEMMVYSSYFAVTATPWGPPRPVRTVTVDVLRNDILRDYPALAARIRPGPSPDAPTARSGLPRAVRRIMRDTTGRYPSRSEREYAVLAAMVNARWADDRIIGAVTSTSGMFGDALRTADRIRRGEITPAQGAAYVRTAIVKLRAAGDRPDVVTLRTDAARLADAVDAIAPGELTTRRAHETDRAVLRAVLARMIAAAAPDVAVAIRDIVLHVGAGIAMRTAANGLKRLTAAGWLARTSTGTVTQAATYGLGDRARDTLARSGADTNGHDADTKCTLTHPALCVSVHFVSKPVTDGRPLTDDDAAAPFVAALAAHRAIRPAAVAWRTMVGAMLTPADLADVLGVHLRTARRHIERLRAYGLVVTDGTAYTSTMRADVVETAAERLGIAAKRDAVAARIAAERDGIRRTINRRDRRDRERAGRMLRARLGIGADAAHAPAHAPQAVQAAPDAHTAPQAVDDAQRAVQAAPDAPVSMTTDGVTLAAPVHGLAAITSTTAPDDITHTVTALRTAPPAAVSLADVDVDAGALFGQAATITPPAAHRQYTP
jgi:hypothetical protein